MTKRTTPYQQKWKCAFLQNLTLNNVGQQYYNESQPANCPLSFDSNMCWNSTEPGTTSYLDCPFEICDSCNISFVDRAATRQCFTNGTWGQADYRKCREIYFNMPYCIEFKCDRCLDDFRATLGILTLVLSLISAVLLIISFIIFSSFQSLQCRRLTIHKHLAVAFIIRFLIVTVWMLTQMYSVFQGCSSVPYNYISDCTSSDCTSSIQFPGWLCKSILFLYMYTAMASTFWMFVEGAYLASRFTIFAMRSSESSFGFYIAVGWVLPLFFVCCWAVSMELQPDLKNRCWLPYSNNPYSIGLLFGPIGVALAVNVLFMLIVLAVLVTKLKSSNTMESATIWKTIKATLLLVPLLGVSNLLVFYEPSSENVKAVKVYMVITTVLQHSQGIFVAVLYCFINTEVQEALQRWLKKWPFYCRYLEKKTRKAYANVTQCETDPEKVSALRKPASSPNMSRSIERQPMVEEGAVEVLQVDPNQPMDRVKIKVFN